MIKALLINLHNTQKYVCMLIKCTNMRKGTYKYLQTEFFGYQHKTHYREGCPSSLLVGNL